jgi:DNA repair protein RadA/Sms
MKSIFICQNCSASYPKWQGQCAQCGEWNTLVEEAVEKTSAKSTRKSSPEIPEAKFAQLVRPLSEVKLFSGSKPRFSSGIGELDRVLGGGIVPGAVMLVGGEPGIGKSTLLTQMCLVANFKESGETSSSNQSKQSSTNNKNSKQILYICGEESPEQINLRISRIFDNEQFLSKSGFGKSSKQARQQIEQNLQFVTSTDVDEIRTIIKKINPKLVIVDSIQTLSTQDLTGASGSVGQIRESTERLIKIAKSLSIATFLVGHVTKEGTIAGPKVLEHMVDTVLQLEGERTGQFRLLRALKNRFGATDEVGVFKVVDYGYEEVTNPSELFVENESGEVPGSAVTCVMEGTRPMLLEVQALVNQSQLAMPRRVGRGIELFRIQILAAVMQKHAKHSLSNYDIFLSAAGGFSVKEPAVDLALSVAIASSLSNKAIKTRTVFIGEVGLLGEVRTVPYLDRRIKEAKRLGYKRVVSAKTHKWLKEVLREI